MSSWRESALLRRYHVCMGKASGTGEEKENYLEMGGIRIHGEFNEVFVDGAAQEMSDIEYHMLLLMMRHPRKLFSARNLYGTYFLNCGYTFWMR